MLKILFFSMGEKDFGWEWPVLLHVPTISERKKGRGEFYTYIYELCVSSPRVGQGYSFPLAFT